MYKSKTSEKINFENSNLIIFFLGVGSSPSFSLSLLFSNYEFKNVGYLYSECLSCSVCNSYDSKNLEFNGSLYYNASKNITLLDLTGGIKSRELNGFTDELVKFIKDNKFGKIYLIGSSSKDNVLDIDIVSKIINIYYFCNDENEKMLNTIKNIKDAFKVKDEERKGKKYYELSLLEGCESLKRVAQKLILEKMKFVLIFGFAGDMFDPFCGLGLYQKIALILGLTDKDEEVRKEELDNITILDNFSKKGIKIDNSWKILFKLD